jgi:hypothetical protein
MAQTLGDLIHHLMIFLGRLSVSLNPKRPASRITAYAKLMRHAVESPLIFQYPLQMS